jgi:hypothetical protein
MKRSVLALMDVVLMAISVLAGSVLLAQDAVRAPDGGTTFHVGGVELLAISGAPFSGKSNVEWTRTMQDGNTITSHLQANLARDSQGRMYRERRSFVPASQDPSPRVNEIHIYDPVTRSQTICDPFKKECVVTNYFPQTRFVTRPPGPFANGTRYLTREELGTATIADFKVTGSLETVTVNPGVIGNDHPLVSTREFWYNPELQTNLKVIRNEPATGKQVVLLTDVSQGEPDPELFKPPAGYVIKDNRTPQQLAGPAASQ